MSLPQLSQKPPFFLWSLWFPHFPQQSAAKGTYGWGRVKGRWHLCSRSGLDSLPYTLIDQHAVSLLFLLWLSHTRLRIGQRPRWDYEQSVVFWWLHHFFFFCFQWLTATASWSPRSWAHSTSSTRLPGRKQPVSKLADRRPVHCNQSAPNGNWLHLGIFSEAKRSQVHCTQLVVCQSPITVYPNVTVALVKFFLCSWSHLPSIVTVNSPKPLKTELP